MFLSCVALRYVANKAPVQILPWQQAAQRHLFTYSPALFRHFTRVLLCWPGFPVLATPDASRPAEGETQISQREKKTPPVRHLAIYGEKREIAGFCLIQNHKRHLHVVGSSAPLSCASITSPRRGNRTALATQVDKSVDVAMLVTLSNEYV